MIVSKEITNIIFQESIDYYYSVLKQNYLHESEKSTDKGYAANHFQSVLFTDNEMVPKSTILFIELIYSFEHFNRLNTNTAFDNTFNLLEDIKIVSIAGLNKAISYFNGDNKVILPNHYLKQIENNTYSLNKLIEHEKLVLNSTLENLCAALALYAAGQKLYKAFNQEISLNSDLSFNQKTSSGHQYRFTQKQQVLSLYFLMKDYGINSKKYLPV